MKKSKAMIMFMVAMSLLFMFAPFRTCKGTIVAQAASSTQATSKKGIQVTNLLDVLDYNASKAFLNVDLANYVSSEYQSGWESFTVNNKTYYFNSSFFSGVGGQINTIKQNGVDKIFVQIYSQKFSGLTTTATPSGRTPIYYALNTSTAAGRSMVTKVFELIGKYWGSYVDYWIIGNEVNDQHRYYEMNTTNLDTYVTNYEKALRICNDTMKKFNSNAQVMICIDHEWVTTANNVDGRFDTKQLLTKLAAKTKADGDYNWGVVCHPYPEPLTSANWWDDGNSGATNSENTERITLYNFDVFTNFMQKSGMQYNKTIRTIAVTECGFNAYENGRENQKLQAAAFTRAYYLMEANPYVTAFIIRADKDSAAEANAGMYFGLESQSGDRREIYNVFKYIDTKYGYILTDRYKSYFNVSSWNSIIPNFSSIKFDKNIKFAAATLSGSSTIKSGSTVTVSTTVAGGSGGYQYEYILDTASGYSIPLQAYSTNSKLSVKLRLDGNANIRVNVKDSKGEVLSDTISIQAASQATDNYTGLVKYVNSWYYVKNGKMDLSYSGLVKRPENSKWYYVANGKLDWSYTSLVKYNGTWFYVEKGMLNTSYTGLAKRKENGGWYYVKNGKIDWNYSNLVKYNGNWFYVEKGRINWSYTSLVKYNGTWFYVEKAKLNTSYTGLAKRKENGRWYYVKNGKLDWSYTGFVLYNGYQFYVQKGCLDLKYTSLVKDNGVWKYIANGKLNTSYSGLVLRVENNNLYYVANGEIDWSYTSLTKYQGEWYYVQKGRPNMSYTGLAKRKENGGWYYVKDGKIDWSYTGFVFYNGYQFYVQKGSLSLRYTSLVKDNGIWKYVANGKLNTSYTGLALRVENNNLYYVANGILDWSYNGVVRYSKDGNYYFVEKGMVRNYTGIEYIEDWDAYYYIEESQVNTTYTGVVIIDEQTYYVENGRVNLEYQTYLEEEIETASVTQTYVEESEIEVKCADESYFKETEETTSQTAVQPTEENSVEETELMMLDETTADSEELVAVE